MNRDDIIRMAREAGVHHINLDDDYIEEFIAFAELVAAAEREACAKVCEEVMGAWTETNYNDACGDCAHAILARGAQ